MDLLVMIFVAVVCVAIGFGLGKWSGASHREKGEEERAGPADEKPGWVSVLHLWRDPQTQAIVLETRGKVADYPAGLEQEDRDSVLAAQRELERWLGGPGVPGTAALGNAPLSGILEEVPGTAAVPGTAGQRPARPSLNPIDVISNALRAEVRDPAAWTERSVAAQVDDVLQEMLAGTPLAQRGIRLLDGPDGGLVVQVGIEKYAGVEEVPEAEIRALISGAGTEWGRRVGGR